KPREAARRARPQNFLLIDAQRRDIVAQESVGPREGSQPVAAQADEAPAVGAYPEVAGGVLSNRAHRAGGGAGQVCDDAQFGLSQAAQRASPPCVPAQII